MTDKELLGRAAKASGLDLSLDGNGQYWPKLRENQKFNSIWNPLTDDGDALRLAVKLNIDIFGDNNYRRAEIDNWNCAEEVQNNDPYAATRRAIVRAAAEIGYMKRLEEKRDQLADEYRVGFDHPPE